MSTVYKIFYGEGEQVANALDDLFKTIEPFCSEGWHPNGSPSVTQDFNGFYVAYVLLWKESLNVE